MESLLIIIYETHTETVKTKEAESVIRTAIMTGKVNAILKDNVIIYSRDQHFK